jgi:hypothetical protein
MIIIQKNQKLNLFKLYEWYTVDVNGKTDKTKQEEIADMDNIWSLCRIPNVDIETREGIDSLGCTDNATVETTIYNDYAEFCAAGWSDRVQEAVDYLIE